MQNASPDIAQLIGQVLQGQSGTDDGQPSAAGSLDWVALFARYAAPLLQGDTSWLRALGGSPVFDIATQLATHYATLSHRDSAIAAALGACRCWGEQPDCEHCGGEGAPGWMLPDPDAFREYVQPAIDAVRHERRWRQRASLHRVVNHAGET